jgi:hypothetical protein
MKHYQEPEWERERRRLELVIKRNDRILFTWLTIWVVTILFVIALELLK